MDINEMLERLSLKQKIDILTGADSMKLCSVDELGIDAKQLADGPHGIRINDRDWDDETQNCTMFPSMCCLGASWDVKLAEEVGKALGDDCAAHGVDMLLGPGANIKRYMLCGRNFEYISEDPYIAGKIAAGYIRGLQSKGVAASLKHFAANSQEVDRGGISSEMDERTMREIYLKSFEIAVKESQPESVMCAFNKINSIWCSENKYLLSDILRDEWRFEGLVVSDWGAVHDPVLALKAGLDLQMPYDSTLYDKIKEALDDGRITEEDIDRSAGRMLKFMMKSPVPKTDYNRKKLHECAVRAAAGGTVLLKNENNALPVNKEKYKNIFVVGEFADSPLINGQGSAEVYPDKEYIDSPLEKLRKRLPGVRIEYKKYIEKASVPVTMLWPYMNEYKEALKDSDAVIVFIGAMESEDTEYFDKMTAVFNPNYEMLIEEACNTGKKVIVVMQNGGAKVLGKWHERVDAIIEMWLGGEGAGSAVADIICGIVNPSGKLTETFPNKMRNDLEYPGDGYKVRYRENFEVGYRYYDLHPEDICYPFGHGLSYTTFEYIMKNTELSGDLINIELDIRNTGEYDGAEVVQVYVSDPVSTVSKPVKELKAFKKVFVKANQTENVKITLPVADLAYYNIMLHSWVTEDGEYKILIGSSSRDIRLEETVEIYGTAPYTIYSSGATLLG